MSQITIHAVRDGAKCIKDDQRVLFNAACASEYLNPNRSTAPMPPLKDLPLLPGVIYRVHTGLQLPGCTAMPVRPTPEIFAVTGMIIYRVDELKDELVIYVTVMKQIVTSIREPWFETFALAAYDIEVVKGPPTSNSHVTELGPTVASPPQRQQLPAPNAARELSDEEKRKKFDAFLRADIPPAEGSPGTIVHRPPVAIPDGASRFAGLGPGTGA